MQIFKFYIAFFLFLGIPMISFGQEYPFIHYTTKDGLPSSKVYDVVQDREGYMWFATDNGVAKFDGYEFKTFTVKDGLPTNDIWGLMLDSEDRIWLQSYAKKLIYIKNDKIHFIKIPNSKNQLCASRPLIEGENSKIWIKLMGEGSLRYFKNDSIFTYSIHDLLSHNELYTQRFLGEDTNQNLWITDIPANLDHNFEYIFHVLKITPELDTISFFLPTLQKEKIDLYNFWLIDDYIYYWNNENLYSFNIKTNKEQQIAWTKLIDTKSIKTVVYLDNLFWRIDNQLIQFTPDLVVKRHYSLKQDFNIYQALVDKEQNLWLPTSNNGLLCLPKQREKTINYELTNNNFSVSTLAQISDSLVVIGTEDGNVFLKSNKKIFHHYQINEKPISKIIINDNRIFIGNNGGESLYNLSIHGFLNKNSILKSIFPVSYRSYGYFDIPLKTTTISHSSIKNLYLDSPSNTLYVSTGAGFSIIKFKDNNIDFFRTTNEKTYATIPTQNNLFLGRVTGLFDTTNIYKTKRTFPLKNLNPRWFDKSILDLAKDSRDRLWVGTESFGLYACDDCKNGEVKVVKELAYLSIHQVLVDTFDNIWVATNQGVYRIKIKNWETFDYKIDSYTVEDGLLSNEANTILLDNEKIYIGTDQGLSVLNIQKEIKNKTPPPIYFTKILLNTQTDSSFIWKSLDLKKKVIYLKHQENTLRLHYVALSYKSNQKITYSYRTDGIDRSGVWQTTMLLEKEFIGLNPGTYTFRIKARDINGIESEEIALTMVIATPWWQTNWFYACLITFVGLLTWLIINARIKRVKEKIERENTFVQKLAEMELRVLQSQINPHFISNALTAIQHFILNQEGDIASDYLSKFTHLMRLFLDASYEKYVLLEKELDLLTRYVELERLRFPDKFDLIMDLEEGLDTTIELPTLLLQPYVENAINHGLLYKETKGYLKISIRQTNEALICVVEDNGIGRDRAKAIKSGSFKSYKSRGMKLLTEQAKILEEMGTPIEIIVKDTFPKEEDCGTTITIILPLEPED